MHAELLRWWSAVITARDSAGLSLDRSHGPDPSEQLERLRARAAAAISFASAWVSIESSQGPIRSVQFETLRWRSAMAKSLISCLLSLEVSQGLPAILAAGDILLTLCECNCMRFPASKCEMIARSDSVQAIGNICLVDGDIQRDGFECC